MGFEFRVLRHSSLKTSHSKLKKMIQRIQSIYLALASLAFGGQFVVPYATAPANTPATENPAFADGQLNPFDNIGLLSLTILGIAIAAAAIFLFKNRPLQGKMTTLGVMVAVFLFALAGFVFFNLQRVVPAGSPISYNLGFLMPILGGIFSWLAGRAISNDETLVRSADRLR